MLAGILISPVINPNKAVDTKPIKMEPGTLFAIKMAITKIPKIVSQVVGTVKEPISTNEVLLAVTSPPPWRPTKAMKIPIPAAIASFKSFGIALITTSRTLRNERMVKRTEATNTPAIAFCQEIPIPKTTEKVKKALSPNPGATAIG